VALAAIGVAIWLLVAGSDSLSGATDRHGAVVEELTIHSDAVGRDEPVKVVMAVGL
jgi:hypothetical protein